MKSAKMAYASPQSKNHVPNISFYLSRHKDINSLARSIILTSVRPSVHQFIFRTLFQSISIIIIMLESVPQLVFHSQRHYRHRKLNNNSIHWIIRRLTQNERIPDHHPTTNSSTEPVKLPSLRHTHLSARTYFPVPSIVVCIFGNLLVSVSSSFVCFLFLSGTQSYHRRQNSHHTSAILLSSPFEIFSLCEEVRSLTSSNAKHD